MSSIAQASKIVNLDDYRKPVVPKPIVCEECGGGGEVLAENGRFVFCEACDYGQAKAAKFKEWLKKNSQDIEEARQRRFAKQFGQIEIPKGFRHLTPDTLESLGAEALRGKREALEAARRWAKGKSDKPGLLLYGAPGTGKSALGWWAAPLRGEGHGLWLTWPNLYKTVQAAYGNSNDAEALMKAAMETCVLFLDDLGDPDRRGLESDDRRDILFRIVNHRLNERLPTFITTNLVSGAFAGQFGERIMSRIYELCDLVEMGGVDLRGEHGERRV